MGCGPLVQSLNRQGGQTKRVMTLARTQRHVLRDGADVVEQDDHKGRLHKTGVSVSFASETSKAQRCSFLTASIGRNISPRKNNLCRNHERHSTETSGYSSRSHSQNMLWYLCRWVSKLVASGNKEEMPPVEAVLVLAKESPVLNQRQPHPGNKIT